MYNLIKKGVDLLIYKRRSAGRYAVDCDAFNIAKVSEGIDTQKVTNYGDQFLSAPLTVPKHKLLSSI